jgi:hypothetical protein
MTKREQLLDEALARYETPPEDIIEQSIAARYLRVDLKLTLNDISTVLKLTKRQVQTRLYEYKHYVAKGLISNEALEEAVLDEDERLARGLLNVETKEALEGQIFESRLAERLAGVTPSDHDLSEIRTMYETLKKQRPSIKGEPETVMACFSDLHYWLVNNSYDVDTATAVVHRFVDKIVLLTNLHRSQCTVSKLALLLIGDLIQGSSGNFAAQRWTTGKTALDQAYDLAHLFILVIQKLLLTFDEIEVDTVFGNHGQLYAKKSSVEPEHANAELVVYRYLEMAFRNEPRVKLNIATEWYQIVDHGGMRVFLTHGHAIPGAGSLDGILANFRKWQDILPAFDCAFTGHFHRLEMLSLPRPFGSKKPRLIFMNGSPVLDDDYSERNGSGHTSAWWVTFAGGGRITASYAVELY